MPVEDLATRAPARGSTLTRQLSAPGRTLCPLPLLLYLVLFAWHLQVVVDPRCVFVAQNDLFLWNFRFLQDFLIVPGGLAQWLGKLILQASCTGWPATVALTGIAWLIYSATLCYLRHLSQAGAVLAWTLPAITLLSAHSHYDYPFSTSVGVALAMVAACGYVQFATGRIGWRFAAFAALALLLYWAGGAAAYVFVCCALIGEFYLHGSRWGVVMLAGVAVGVKCVVDALLSLFPPAMAYLYYPSDHPFRELLPLHAATLAVLGSFPICAVALADWAAKRTARGARPHSPGTAAPAAEESTGGGGNGPSGRCRPVVFTILFLLVAAGVSQLTWHRDLRAALRVHFSADHQQWDEVLHLATCVPSSAYSQYVRHDVNMALFHTGRLPYDMFAFPQESEPFALPGGDDPFNLYQRRVSDFSLWLGRVNDAEFYAGTSWVLKASAHGLRQLARIAMVKERVDLARLFLRVLRDDLVYGTWSAAQLRQLAEDPTCAGDAEIQTLRSLMITDDDLRYALPPTTTEFLTLSDTGQISPLVRREPPGRMVIEYTMARYLAMRSLEPVIQILPQVTALAYPVTPPAYEEAAVIFARLCGEPLESDDAGTVFRGFRISAATMDKIRQLDTILGPDPADPAEVSRVAGELGLDYYRYFYGRGVSW